MERKKRKRFVEKISFERGVEERSDVVTVVMKEMTNLCV